MILRFVALLMSASSSATPTAPSSATLSIYNTSLVRVTWVNSGAYSTKIYKKVSGGAYSLVTTVASGVTTYDTGFTVANGYTFGVSHLNVDTESTITEATALVPGVPVGGNITEY